MPMASLTEASHGERRSPRNRGESGGVRHSLKFAVVAMNWACSGSIGSGLSSSRRLSAAMIDPPPLPRTSMTKPSGGSALKRVSHSSTKPSGSATLKLKMRR